MASGEDDQAWVNAELSRHAIGLQNIRRRLNEITEVEFLASPSQRSAAANRIHATDLVESLRGRATGGVASEEIRAWIATDIPAQIAEISAGLKQEGIVSSTYRYWSVRPLLVSVWHLLRQGSTGQVAFVNDFSNLRAAASMSGTPMTKSESSVPAQLLFIPGMGLGIVGLILLYRRFPAAGLGASAVVALFLVVQVQAALRYNLVTVDAADAMAKGTIASVEAYPFTMRASELRAEIIARAQTNRSNAIASAEVDGNEIKASVEKRKIAYEEFSKCAGLSQVDTNNGFSEISRYMARNRHLFGANEAMEDYGYKDRAILVAKSKVRWRPTEFPRVLP